jgi:peptide/nickel transport system permease protein
MRWIDINRPRNPWVRFAARRLLGLIVVLLFLLVAAATMVRLIPGDPARRIAGAEATQETVTQIRDTLGLNDPVFVQVADYARSVLQLDLGRSFRTGEPVANVISDRFPKTMQLAASSFVAVTVLSLMVGMVAAAVTREGRHPRGEVAFVGITGIIGALPWYFLGTLLSLVFAVRLGWLPPGGANGWESLVLPTAAVSVPLTAILSRIVRVETLNVLTQDYIRAAQSKGLPNTYLYARHALPNVLTATLTVGGLVFSTLIGGTVVIENVFAWPGLGSVLVEAVLARDYPIVQGVVLMLGFAVVIVNALVDWVLVLMDPSSMIRAS